MFDFFKKIFSVEGKEKDPVCGMTIDPKTTAHYSVYQSKHYYFCSPSCKEQFEKNPSQFVG